MWMRQRHPPWQKPQLHICSIICIRVCMQALRGSKGGASRRGASPSLLSSMNCGCTVSGTCLPASPPPLPLCLPACLTSSLPLCLPCNLGPLLTSPDPACPTPSCPPGLPAGRRRACAPRALRRWSARQAKSSFPQIVSDWHVGWGGITPVCILCI